MTTLADGMSGATDKLAFSPLNCAAKRDTELAFQGMRSKAKGLGMPSIEEEGKSLSLGRGWPSEGGGMEPWGPENLVCGRLSLHDRWERVPIGTWGALQVSSSAHQLHKKGTLS